MHTEYQTAAARIMPSSSPEQLVNWALGLCGEVSEIQSHPEGDTQGLLLECGDGAWYCHAMLTALRLDADAVFLGTPRYTPFVSAYFHACQIAELVKKHIYHFKPLNVERLVQHIVHILDHIERLAFLADCTLVEVYRLHIEELQQRYPEGFDA